MSGGALCKFVLDWGRQTLLRPRHRLGKGFVALVCVCFGACAGSFVRGALAGPTPDLGVLDSSMRAAGYAQVLQPREFEFPLDHGPHPEYRQEWWYVTGNLDASDGERFGFELTFFRFALAPQLQSTPAAAFGAVESRWRTRQIYMAHFAITDVARRQFRFTQKLAREALGLAGAQIPPLRVWVDDWSLSAAAAEESHWHLHAAETGYELTLDARALQQPVLNGDRGFSRKSNDPGSASYYYSIPRVTVAGHLLRDGKPIAVHGLAWVDREWGSGTLGKNEQGWDWFALQFKDGSALMFYALRDRDGRRDSNSAGTWISASGQSRPLSSDQVEITVEDYWTNARGERYPGRWRVRVPTVGIDAEVRPVLPDQELTGSTRYWEGAVDVTAAGSGGQKADGRGYVELVGYAGQ